MDTLDNNKLIAEFMNLTLYKGYIYKYYPLSERKERGFWGNQLQYHESKLKYDKSWDWLMPVLDKIRDLKNSCKLSNRPVYDRKDRGFGQHGNKFLVNSHINYTYGGVVEFIKWYNLNKR